MTSFPVVSPADWAEPEQTFTILYRRIETEALEISAWYMRDKKYKKILSQSLRIGAIIFGSAGGIVPILSSIPGSSLSPWLGYLSIAVAAFFVAFDRLFGLSSAWMRDMSAAQAAQRALRSFQYEWAKSCKGLHDGNCDDGRIELLGTLSRELSEIVELETSGWLTEFQRSLSALSRQTAADHRGTSAG